MRNSLVINYICLARLAGTHPANEEAVQSDKNIQPMTNMNKLELKGDWNIVKGKLRQKYGQLTDNDLQYSEGQEEELVGRIQKRTGQTKEAVERVLRDCSKN
jgi:uncharacterized protein YjbJ (UPF0337 family)